MRLPFGHTIICCFVTYYKFIWSGCLYLHGLSSKERFLRGKFMKTESLVTDETFGLDSGFLFVDEFFFIEEGNITNLCHLQLKKCKEGEYRNILLYT